MGVPDGVLFIKSDPAHEFHVNKSGRIIGEDYNDMGCGDNLLFYCGGFVYFLQHKRSGSFCKALS
jgi:hypothetical protein